MLKTNKKHLNEEMKYTDLFLYNTIFKKVLELENLLSKNLIKTF